MKKFELVLDAGVPAEAIAVIVLLVLLVGLLLFLIIRGAVFSGKVARIRDGMSYDEVLDLLGDPYDSSTAGDIITCVWRKAVLRGLTLRYTIVFKDEKVISIVKG